MSRSETIPELSVAVDSVQIFMFSAVTWNRHLIHYDAEQAKHEGHSSVVAQRGLLGNYFVRQLADWLDDSGDVATLDWKVVRSAVPGDVLRCRSEIDEISATGAAMTLSMVNQNDEPIASGQATVRFHE